MTLPQHSSLSNEHYTPKAFTEAARRTMGGIDLDPASCEYANRTVGAARFYTEADDGLHLPWRGNVWLNPPYGRRNGKSNKALWTGRALAAYHRGEIDQACLLVTSSTGDLWFQPLWSCWLCFPRRIKFNVPPGADTANANPGGNVIAYLGPREDQFIRHFGPLGRIVPPDHSYYEKQLTLFGEVA